MKTLTHLPTVASASAVTMIYSVKTIARSSKIGGYKGRAMVIGGYKGRAMVKRESSKEKTIRIVGF